MRNRGRHGADYDAIIVGAGHNGLVAAFYLAASGLSVAVVERRPIVGGAASNEELFEGYSCSSCAATCWLLQPKVIADLELQRHGFAYHPLDPNPLALFEDRSHLPVWRDDQRTQAAIAAVDARDAAAYPQWQAYWRRAAGLLHAFFLREPPTRAELAEHARTAGHEALLHELLEVPLADICARFFRHERVQATLVGVEDIGDPFVAGSALVEAWFHCDVFTEIGQVFVAGGMGELPAAMARAASERGATIKTNAEVVRIVVDPDGVRGVLLADGEELAAPIVVSNADPKRTFLDLLEAGVLPEDFRTAVEALRTNVSYLKFHGVLSELPDLSDYIAHVPSPAHYGSLKIAPSLAHYREAFEEASSGSAPTRPIIGGMFIPTVYDSTLTRRDGHTVSMWVLYAPPAVADGDWQDRKGETANGLIDYVTSYIPNFRSSLREWILFTPDDLERRIGLTAGNIRHLDMVPDQLLGERPLPRRGYRTPVTGLYLCGAGTHPGGEVTGAPGHNAAQAILTDLAR